MPEPTDQNHGVSDLRAAYRVWSFAEAAREFGWLLGSYNTPTTDEPPDLPTTVLLRPSTED